MSSTFSTRKHVHWDTVTRAVEPVGSTSRASPSSVFSSSSSQRYIPTSSRDSRHYVSHQSPMQGVHTPYIGPVPLPPESPPQMPPSIHDLIRHDSDECLDLELSLPTKYFSHSVEPYINLLASPGNPSLSWVTIMVNNKEITISTKRGDPPGGLTIGRVLSDLHGYLREPAQAVSSTQVTRIFKMRVDTLPEAIKSGRRSNEEVKKKEREPGVRNVDFLFGDTRFDGFSVMSDGKWKVHLTNCQRYPN